jgi:DNA-directed RNA polymerase specialized sigma24 family protein
VTSRPLTTLSDERLARLCGMGHEPAFAVLYLRHGGAVFAYCRSMTRNADDGWDAMQNAMIRVLISLRHGERTGPVRPWLFRIAHDEAAVVLRRRSGACAEVVNDPRRPGTRELTPSAWSPLAAWEMLQSVLRVGASAGGLVARDGARHM